MEKGGGGAGVFDLDKTIVTLEPEKSSGGGLYVPGKDRVVYIPPERKSRLGLDVLANAKRGGAQHDAGFKVPNQRTTSIATSVDEEDKSESSVVDESGHGGFHSTQKHANRRYCEMTSETSHAESAVTKDHYGDTYGTDASEHMILDVPASPSGSSSSFRFGSLTNDREDHKSEKRRLRQNSRHDSRSDIRSVRHTNSDESREWYSERGSRDRYDNEYGRKQNRYEGSRRTPDLKKVKSGFLTLP